MKNDIETHYQLPSIKAKNERINIIYLTEDEYNNIYKKNEFDYLNNTRDWLIMCCETTQRISDFINFTKSNIRFDGQNLFIE
jgi:integrase